MPAFSDDLREWQAHSRRLPHSKGDPDAAAPPTSWEDERDGPAQELVALIQPIAEPPPGPVERPTATLLEATPATPAGPVILGGGTWEVGPLPSVRALVRKETATRWGAGVGGFFGLVVLLDFALTHL
jgi:hypothetical protein